jgi:CheY-like chemotaxis protein
MARILVIDDDPAIRKLLRAALELAGYAVAEAGDGVQGVQAFRAHRPDVVLCDLCMPNKDGLETIRELHDNFQGVRVLAMSGGAGNGALDALPFAERCGVAGFLRKPFRLKAVCEAVAAVLSGDAWPVRHPGDWPAIAP